MISFSQVLQIKFASPCQYQVILPTLLNLVHAESIVVMKETLIQVSKSNSMEFLRPEGKICYRLSIPKLNVQNWKCSKYKTF